MVNEQLAATLQHVSKSLQKSSCLGAYTLTWISNITVLFDLLSFLSETLMFSAISAAGSVLEHEGRE